jgi:hypothetical protein
MAVIPKRPEAEDGAALKSELRRMLNERQVLEIVPVSRATFFRMGKAGGSRQHRPISRRTAGSGSKMRSWPGGTRFTSSSKPRPGQRALASCLRAGGNVRFLGDTGVALWGCQGSF